MGYHHKTLMKNFIVPQKIYTVINSCLNAFRKQESSFFKNFYGLFYPGSQLAPVPTVTVEGFWNEGTRQNSELDDHILWGVPKKRRSVEVRRTRRIGSFTGFCKLYPIKKLLTCLVCGHPYEVGLLCPNCYSKVMKATQSIKDAMKNAEGRDPIEHEYEVAFEDEKLQSEDGFYKGKRIIEVPEKRPSWFAKKLTQSTNVTLSGETAVSPPNPLHIKK
ncbi:39S ribosomal protein L32, mitochondrial [Armadillidium vulgare]|nr:39S ribosomal protein L32, mitochondrial [Armadillidium vulgare]